MVLTDEDINRIQVFFTSLESRITEIEKRIEDRFDSVDQNFDALFKRDETSQQEYLTATEQLSRFDKRISVLEQKLR